MEEAEEDGGGGGGWSQLACSCASNSPVLEPEDGPTGRTGLGLSKGRPRHRVSLETGSSQVNVPGRQGREQEHRRQHTHLLVLRHACCPS